VPRSLGLGEGEQVPESTQTPAVVSGIGGIFQKFISVPLALVVAVALWPVRVLGAGIRQMRDILGLLIFLGVGVLIAAAALWYSRPLSIGGVLTPARLRSAP